MFTSKRGKIRAEFQAEEVNILRGVIEEYRAVLDDREGEPEIHERLFPKASLQDDEVDSKYQEMSRDDLDEHKRETLDRVLRFLPPRGGMKREVGPEDIEAWLVVLTDLRLTLGTRIGVTQETMESDFEIGVPADRQRLLLDWLGGNQESLVLALTDQLI
jgi:hypothetical protein